MRPYNKEENFLIYFNGNNFILMLHFLRFCSIELAVPLFHSFRVEFQLPNFRIEIEFSPQNELVPFSQFNGPCSSRN